MEQNLITLHSCYLFEQSSSRETEYQEGHLVCLLHWSVCLFRDAFIISFSQYYTCLFWFREFLSTLLNQSVRALPAVSNSLTRPDDVCQKQWRVMACVGKWSLSSGMLLRTALAEDRAATAMWLWEAYENILELISVTDHQDTHSPSFCCKVEMLLQRFPSPSLLPSARHWWMCTHILLHNDPLALFTLQSSYRVAMNSDSDLCGSTVTLVDFIQYTVTVCCIFLIMCVGWLKLLLLTCILHMLNILQS